MTLLIRGLNGRSSTVNFISNVEDLHAYCSTKYNYSPTADVRYLNLKGNDLKNEDIDGDLCTVLIVGRLRGGKGGFGANLRSQGGKMASKKTDNFESCRDLSGRRLGTVNEARRLANHIQTSETRKREEREQLKKKLEDIVKRKPRQKSKVDNGEFVQQSRQLLEKSSESVEEGIELHKQIVIEQEKKKMITKKNAEIAAKKLGIWDDIPDGLDSDSDDNASTSK